jgi:hypothetical protein
LRKLWLSDPIFANLDGLNDYDENFNLIDKIIAAADTNYKVGRGMLSQEEIDAEAGEQAAVDGEDSADGGENGGDEGDKPDDGDVAALAADDDDDDDGDGEDS